MNKYKSKLNSFSISLASLKKFGMFSFIFYSRIDLDN